MTRRRPPADAGGHTYVKRRGYAHVPNGTVFDQRLSYAALGLLLVLLALPDGARQGYRDVMGRGAGQAATLRLLRELGDAGYRHQVRRLVPDPDNGGRPTFRTDTVVSEEPLTAAEAAAWLEDVAARRDAEMAARAQAVDNPVTVRENPTHGVTRQNTPSSQVAPCVGSPWHGAPWHGEPTHVVRTTQVPATTDAGASVDQGPNTNARATSDGCQHGTNPGHPCPACPLDAECGHGAPLRTGCPLCRRGVPTRVVV